MVITDASQGDGQVPGGLGGFVAQIHPKTGRLQPLGFMARKLEGAELSYCPRRLERRALIATLHKFSKMLMGERLAILARTDNKNLTSLQVTDKSGVLPQAEATELDFLNRFKKKFP